MCCRTLLYLSRILLCCSFNVGSLILVRCPMLKVALISSFAVLVIYVFNSIQFHNFIFKLFVLVYSVC